MDILGRNFNSSGETDLKDKTFSFLFKLMGLRNQLRINHWQTESYAEHKLTDQMLGDLDGVIDAIGEMALGMFERPQINTVSTNICDIKICSTKYIIDEMDKDVCSLLEEYKVTTREGMISSLGDFLANIKKYKYLSTLSK